MRYTAWRYVAGFSRQRLYCPPVRSSSLMNSKRRPYCAIKRSASAMLQFELALRSHAWHKFEHASVLIAGTLFWRPVVYPARRGLSPDWLPSVYLFVATLPCDTLSAFLTFGGHALYRPYLAEYQRLGLSGMEDQSLAGALMWVTVTFAYLIP